MRTLLIFAILLVLTPVASLFAGTNLADATWTPKLALDLEGGTQIILQPVATEGDKVTEETINQAIAIIRQRVDSSGVSEAEITSQGGNKIVVGLAGQPSEATLDLVRTSAQMEFRPVIQVGAPTPTDLTEAPAASPSGSPSPSASPSADAEEGKDDRYASLPKEADLDTSTLATASDLGWLTQEAAREFDELDCTDPANLAGRQGNPERAFVTCESDGSIKYLLGPLEIAGSHIVRADSGLRQTGQVTSNQRIVTMEFDGEGGEKFAEVTRRIKDLEEPRNQFAMVLDGLVLSAPNVRETITGGNAEISGQFTQAEATTLANQLNFGALPLSFEVLSEQQISATLGSEQLQRGLLAGLIGLLLVVVYSVFQYRALGLVTVASLTIAAVLTYLALAILSWTQGYRLSLPGVAGVIVAIGITADSFIVYFERVRDELRDGRSLPAAVERGWARAKRTILASDGVNFLAAVVLYSLAVGGVRGFAFTLGLTTIIDLAVVFLFTHPIMVLLARTKFFGEGHALSGLDPRRLGVDRPRYVGRGKVTQPGLPRAGRGSSAAESDDLVSPGDRPLTIAERRAAAARSTSTTSEGGEL